MTNNERTTGPSPRFDDPRPYLMQLPLRTRLAKANQILVKLDEFSESVRATRNDAVIDLASLGFTYAEIGELLGVSVTRVKQLIDSEPKRAITVDVAENSDFPLERPHLTTLVGDSNTSAPYRGYTTGVMATPVFFDPHSALKRNRPPAIAIIGAPGAGKTVLADSIVSNPGSSDVTSVVLDPKGDFADLHPTWKQVNVTKDALSGTLDPFRFAATDVILGVLRHLHYEPFSEEMEHIVLDCIVAEQRHSAPTMLAFAERVRANPNREASAFGEMLTQQVAAIPGADAIFGPNDGGVLSLISAGEVTALRQAVNQIADPSLNLLDYSLTNRFSLAIRALLLAHVEYALRQLPKAAPKLLVIDAVEIYPPADIARLARMGRSHNLALILMAQSPDHVTGNPMLRNTVGTTFAFRLNPQRDAAGMSELLQSGANLTDDLRTLHPGECFMCDADGRLERVQIAAPPTPAHGR